MKTKGIRISDREKGYVSVDLSDILKEISNGDSFYWSILSLYSVGDLGLKKLTSIPEEKIDQLEKGMLIEWNELSSIKTNSSQIIDTIIIGCKEKKFLKRYKKDQEMYETCDIVINMFDSSYWEIFSKDESLINRLASKFKETMFLESDFLSFDK